MSTELYRKHRPTTLDDVVGQPETVGVIKKWLQKDKVPHAILLTGNSGCGKTTIARILKRELGCKNNDFFELNCADFRGIDTVRDIRSRMNLAALGKCRIWMLDEVGNMSKDGQTALLKMLEDTPSNVYFFLCTTDPQKLIKTIITRCSELKVRPLSPKDMGTLIAKVTKEEVDKHLSTEVIDKIIEAADGSARKALVLLGSIIELESEPEQLEAISKSDNKRDAIEIARTLLNGRSWPEMAKILKACDLSDPEGIRQLILAYNTTILLGGGGPMIGRAAMILERFEDNWYSSGRAGLVLACYDILNVKR